MTPLERAARALAESNWHPSALERDPDAWKVLVEDVRIVLQAISEPNEAMLEAAENADPLECRSGEWRAMINALLDEKP